MAGTGGDQAGGQPRKVSMRINKKELASILAFDQHLQQANGIQLLTPEGRVLLRLALDGAMSVSAAQLFAGTSQGTYFNILRRLKAAGLIAAVTDEKDARVKMLQVGMEQK